MDVKLVVVPDGEAAAAAAAAALVETARGGGVLALAGGTTPRRAYELAAAALQDWSRATLWLGDERCIPPGDPRSNLRLVRESLLDRLAAPPAVEAVRTELSPEEAAADYDARLHGVTFDLALLGLGPDGHTASLFPHAPALDVRDRLAVAAAPGLEPLVERVTLTVPALAAARRVVFLACGAGKAEAARRAFAEPASPATPASLVRAASGDTLAILDEAAAALIA